MNRSTFGYRIRPTTPGDRETRRLLIVDSIGQVHSHSPGTYGYPRVQATLRSERDLVDNHELVAGLMADLGLWGASQKEIPQTQLGQWFHQ